MIKSLPQFDGLELVPIGYSPSYFERHLDTGHWTMPGTHSGPREAHAAACEASLKQTSSCLSQLAILFFTLLSFLCLSVFTSPSPSPTITYPLHRPCRFYSLTSDSITIAVRVAFGRSFQSLACRVSLPIARPEVHRPFPRTLTRRLHGIPIYTRAMESSDDDMPLAGSRRPNGTNGGTLSSWAVYLLATRLGLAY